MQELNIRKVEKGRQLCTWNVRLCEYVQVCIECVSVKVIKWSDVEVKSY